MKKQKIEVFDKKKERQLYEYLKDKISINGYLTNSEDLTYRELKKEYEN